MAGAQHSRNPAPLLHLPPQETEASRRDMLDAIAGRTRWRDAGRYAVFQVLRVLARVGRPIVIERRAAMLDGKVCRRGPVKVAAPAPGLLSGGVPDFRFIYRRGGGRWYVQITIPVPLRQRLGRKLIQLSLETADVTEARDRRWPYLHGWRKAFEVALADPELTRAKLEEIAAREVERQKALERGG